MFTAFGQLLVTTVRTQPSKFPLDLSPLALLSRFVWRQCSVTLMISAKAVKSISSFRNDRRYSNILLSADPEILGVGSVS